MNGEETYPAAVVDALLEGQNPIKVFRKNRGLIQKEARRPPVDKRKTRD